MIIMINIYRVVHEMTYHLFTYNTFIFNKIHI